MILYDSSPYRDVRDYGILIPLSASRPDTIVRYLRQKHTRLPVWSFADACRQLGIADTDSVLSRSDVERVHEAAYVARLYDDDAGREAAILSAYELVNADGTYNRYTPQTATKPLRDLFDASIARAAGSYLCCRLALADIRESVLPHFCYYLEGGSHHPRYDQPSGFGFLHDVMIAARKILAEGRAGLIWIIDVDAHKGDGTAELIKRARDTGDFTHGAAPDIIALSVHMARGWPLDAESLAQAVPGHAPLIPSDVDIPIDAGEEADYVPRLREGLRRLEHLSGGRKPDLIIVDDGMDVYEKDELPSTALLRLSLEQCLERGHCLLSYIRERGIPSAWFMAGGYGEAAWEPTAHFLAALGA